MVRAGQTILLVVITVLIGSLAPCLAGSQEDGTEPGGKKPLPRWRIGPDGSNATPAPAPDQPRVPYAVEIPGIDSAPESCLVSSPPEYGPIDGVLYQYFSGSWSDVVTDLVANLTGDPSFDEIAYVVVDNATQQSLAESDFTAAGADLSKVEFILMPTDSIWIRDYGPHFIWQGGADAIVDSDYYPGRNRDNFIPTRLGDEYFVNPTYDIEMYYSGGNFQASTARHGFVTALIHADNPGFGETYIAELYSEYQGIDTLHILPQLPAAVDGTGHVDMWFYLVDEDSVIISEFKPGSDPDAIDITENAVTYMEGLGYEVFRTPAWNGSNPGGWSHYTYTNAFRVNDRIFIPGYGEGDSQYNDEDGDALAAWQQAAGPSVEIVPINCYDIIWASGAIHCIVKQVPRYTGSTPSACVTSPHGGEVLVPMTEHGITWTAADDGSVDAVDLHYSTDGGLTWPPEQVIATGLTDDGFHTWTVPSVETAEARVKVTAHDDAANTVEEQSETDFAIEPAVVHIYDFSTGAGIDRWGWGSQTTEWSVLDGVRRPASVGTELSSTSYARMAASDATGGSGDTNRYISPTPGFFSESTHIFEFTIDEDPAKILDIGLHWEGYGADCVKMEMYIWDQVAGQWCDGAGECGENRSVGNFAGNADGTLNGHIRSGFDRYIGPGSILTVLVYAERNWDATYHDYLSVTVVHEPCAGPDADFDGYADGCDNCPLDVNLSQANGDGDARGDDCDCAPADNTAFAVPSEIANLVMDDKTTMVWDSDAPNSGSGTTYDVLRGDVGEYPVGTGPSETCQADDLADTTLGGLPDPAAGSGHYYLVRGGNVCGTGTYGFDSDAVERTGVACP